MNDDRTPEEIQDTAVEAQDAALPPEVPVPTPPRPPVPEPSEPLPPAVVVEPSPAPPPPTRTYQESRSPGLAATLAILPGLGHLYVGAYRRAVMLITTFFLAIYLLPLPVSVFVAIFIWFFGMFDAYRQAQIANRWQEADAPGLKQIRDSGLAFGVFLLIVGAILLIDNFFPIDFYWLSDWWPAILVLAGVYLIGSALFERMRDRGNASAETEYDID